MNVLNVLRREIDATHLGLGGMAVLSLIAVKAHRCLFLVAPPGCGKSTVTRWLAHNCPRTIAPDALTVSGLISLQEELSYFDGAVIVDDLAAVDTLYARLATVTALVQLTYGGGIRSLKRGFNLEITDFRGGSVINMQPNLLSWLMGRAEWEALCADKTLRYYHLRRPTTLSTPDIEVKAEWGIDLRDVDDPPIVLVEALRGHGGDWQWGRARFREHCRALLRAVAALEGRKVVHSADAKLLASLMAPMTFEEYAVTRDGLVGGRKLDPNVLALAVELATFGRPTLEDVRQSYKVSLSQLYRIIEPLSEHITLNGEGPKRGRRKTPKRLQPSAQLADALRKAEGR